MRTGSQLAKLSAATKTLAASVVSLSGRIEAVEEDVGTISRRLDEIAETTAAHGPRLQTTIDVLQMLHDDESSNRSRLHELRRSRDYEAAYTEPDPLVTVVIPTYTGVEMLRERSIPSALAQTHPNIEIVVAGDAAPPEIADTIASFDDDRLRYYNLTIRGPYPPDPRQSWLVSGTPPYNLGVSEARGRWIAPLGDDDAFMPDHIERLLSEAREHRLELVYGLLRQNDPDGTHTVIGAFPPELGQFGLQASLLHSGLRFMEMHLTDVHFGLPNDFALCRRMLRAGVRIGMLDHVVCDYYPSALWGRRDAAPDDSSPAQPRRVTGPERTGPEEPTLHQRIEELQRHTHALEAQLAAVRTSKSWRWTSPLRWAVGRTMRT